MSLRSNTLWEVLKSAFSQRVWEQVWPAVGDTLYMVAVSALITLVLGVILGVLLYITPRGGICPAPWFNRVAGTIVNCLRSLPQMIMIIVTLPLARAVLGKGYGSGACIIALAASCTPMFGRMAESALTEVSKGKLEAAKAMGSSTLQIIFMVLLPEALASLTRAFTTALIAIVSMTALAGSFGAGGIGDIAVRYGFQRFQHDMLIATVLVLIVIVQIIQVAVDVVSRTLLKKWKLI